MISENANLVDAQIIIIRISEILKNEISVGVGKKGLILTARGSTLDVCRRQILTSKVNPRTVRVQLCIMTIDP